MINGHSVKQKDKMMVYDYALIDTLGKFIVPFGQFKNISAFINGYATATNSSSTVLFDTNGKEVWQLQKNYPMAFHIPTPIVVKQNTFRVVVRQNSLCG